jgi:hypothetical protein
VIGRGKGVELGGWCMHERGRGYEGGGRWVVEVGKHWKGGLGGLNRVDR